MSYLWSWRTRWSLCPHFTDMTLLKNTEDTEGQKKKLFFIIVFSLAPIFSYNSSLLSFT